MKGKSLVILAISAIIGIFCGYYYFITQRIEGWETRGQFGDTFGFLTAFFSALAFLGLIYTVFQQNEIIRQSKIDTENSINEFNESIRQFQRQQYVQRLTTLIFINESRLNRYREKKQNELAIETERTLINLTSELDNFLKG